MRILVVGGSGFVGTRVMRAALLQGARVTSVSRKGAPIGGVDSTLSEAEWLQGDVVAGGESLRDMIKGHDAVISCLGAFGTNEAMHLINGTANAELAEAAAEVGVKRFAFVSAAVIRPVANMMTMAGLEGYYAGKLTAEAAVTTHFGDDGLILRPGPIYGTRAVSSSISIPLGAIGVPLTTIFEMSPVRSIAGSLPFGLGDLVMPWVNVEDVAGAAVAHAMGKTSEGKSGGGEGGGDQSKVLEWTEIRKEAAMLRMATTPEVSLFWDGGCPLCKLEIDHYKAIDAEKRVRWVDITTTEGKAKLTSAGVTSDAAVALIHAIDHGRGDVLRIGAPAFLAVWERMPRPWSVLPPILSATPFAMPVMDAVYRLWARHRLKISGTAARALEQGSACNGATGDCGLKKSQP